MQQQQTVFVGLSGGVDSAVSALRLKNAGYNVAGVFIKVWHPDFLECNWEEERLDAMRVAAHLDIPFMMCDAERAYKDEVAQYFINEYRAGRTPNPDVLCNRAIKFGAFLEFAKQHGADYVATGHYARRIMRRSTVALMRGVDKNKDQSYFLWSLTQDQLRHILLPIGESTKDEIRREANAAGLPVSEKKDSQGICFLGHIDIPEFLGHYIDLHPGNVLDESGSTIGTHRGAVVYTLGQRHGFDITEADTARTPHYVTAKDIEQNTITVSSHPPKSTQGAALKLESVNWIHTPPPTDATLVGQTRYRQKPVAVRVANAAANTASVALLDAHEAVAPGQSCVLYDGDECLGGGIIAA